jgi:hypothetical protein
MASHGKQKAFLRFNGRPSPPCPRSPRQGSSPTLRVSARSLVLLSCLLRCSWCTRPDSSGTCKLHVDSYSGGYSGKHPYMTIYTASAAHSISAATVTTKFRADSAIVDVSRFTLFCEPRQELGVHTRNGGSFPTLSVEKYISRNSHWVGE